MILDLDGKIFQTFRLVGRDSHALKIRNKNGMTVIFEILNAQQIGPANLAALGGCPQAFAKKHRLDAVVSMIHHHTYHECC